LEGRADRPATVMLVDLPLLGRLEDYPLGQIDDIVLKPCRDGELVTRLKMAADRRKSLASPAHGHQGYDPELMEKMNLESLGLLAGGIAHDLNNYLAVILGSIALARAMPPDPENLSRVLDRIEKAAMQARDLSNSLLAFSQGGSPVKKAFRLEQLLRDAAAFVLEGTNVRPCFSIAADLRSVVGDEAQIRQVLHNILLNAVQAMPGGGCVHIKAVNHHPEQPADKAGMPPAGKDYVKITIQDDGPGIPAKYMDKIFNPFFTSRAKGRGLGLTTVQILVKRNNGFVEVQSREGEGTALHIYLPACMPGQEGRF
jgi:two-component system cell cycle sensor histidine kinase/response regulator CckA